MGIKFSSVMFVIFAVFLAKISLDNFNEASAKEHHTERVKTTKILVKK